MARIPNTPPIRTLLAEASAWMTDNGAPGHLAGAVDKVLAPGGWAFLQHTDPMKSEGTEANMNIDLPKAIREEIVAAVDADPEAPSVTAKINEGFNKFLDGEFVLPDRATALSVHAQQRAMLNVRPLSALAQQITERGVKPARVAAEYLMSCYELGPYAPGAITVLPRGRERNPEIPRVVRDAIRAEATRTGWRTDDVINEGWQKFLDGEFSPVAPVWTPEARADMVIFKVRPNDDLFAKVAVVAKARGLRPMQVAFDYLLDEFEITDGVAVSTE